MITKSVELPKLPNGWVWTKIGEIMEVIRGASPRPKGDPRYFGGNIPWIMISDISKEEGKYISKTRDKVTQEGAKKSRYLKAGTLILSNSGTVCVPKILAADGCIHDGFVAFPNFSANLEMLYIYYYFQYIRQKIINENRQGVTQVNLNTGIVREIAVPLAPFSEQGRIVSKVEELFSFLEAGTESLHKVQAQLKRYRQAVLKYAFEGKLTQQWRIKHQEEYEKVAEKTNAGNPQGLPLLPDGWKWVKLNELGYFTGGGTPSTENPKFWNGHILWVSPKDMKSDFISNSELKITNYGVENSSVNLIPKNSVLIVARSGILKRTLPVSINTEECTVNQDIKVLVPYAKEMSKFIRIMLKGFESNILNNLVKEGTTVHSLKYREFENQLFPIPPIDEQKKIVENVEKHLLSIDKTENAVSRDLIIAEKLRQSILKQAFMGELVSQDLGDEHAEKLLECIKAERLTNNSKNNQVELSQYVK